MAPGPSLLIAAGHLVTDGDAGPGWLSVEGDRIAAVGAGRPPGTPDVEHEDWLVPGYVDVHVHGGGGGAFASVDPDEVELARRSHLAHGTTTMLASLVTAAPDTLAAQLDALAEPVREGRLAGVHLEGPWLSRARKGAHEEALLAAPDPREVAGLVDHAAGVVRMVTLAPELPGALETIRLLRDQGVVAAVGHTDATPSQVAAAIDAGATGATHLFNGMPLLHHRSPGPALPLWADERVFLELILDGVHVDPALAAFVIRTAPGRVALVTDAMAAAGVGDGEFRVGDLAVTVRDTVAHLSGTTVIAGSTLLMAGAVRNAVAAGVPLPVAIDAATRVPARYLGLADVGRLEPGCRADLVLLDGALQVAQVIRRGEWIT